MEGRGKWDYLKGGAEDPAAKKLFSPSADRNAAPILGVLSTRIKAHVDARGTRAIVLELASGTGQHAAYMARGLQGDGLLDCWYPSDVPPFDTTSVRSWARELGSSDFIGPGSNIDLSSAEWWIDAPKPSHIFVANMTHIAPWACSAGLLQGASHLLPRDGGALFVYGPFTKDGEHNSEGNVAFDKSLRSQNSSWGIRDIRDLEAEGARHGLKLVEEIAMPANNRILVWQPEP